VDGHLVPLAWFLNTTVLFPTRMKEIKGGRDYVRERWAQLGPQRRGARAAPAVFGMDVHPAGLAGWPFWATLLVIIAIMVPMSELTSNTAQVATMLPILAALGPVLGAPAGVLLVPATVAASCASMMPVGTPSNAIVFDTGLVRMPQMMKAGVCSISPASSPSSCWRMPSSFRRRVPCASPVRRPFRRIQLWIPPASRTPD